jgi:thioredoxin reductase
MPTVREPIGTDVATIGAGRCGLFQVFELARLDPRAHIIDALPIIGGPYAELHPNKPIYNISRLSRCRRKELIERLLEQTNRSRRCSTGASRCRKSRQSTRQVSRRPSGG